MSLNLLDAQADSEAFLACFGPPGMEPKSPDPKAGEPEEPKTEERGDVHGGVLAESTDALKDIFKTVTHIDGKPVKFTGDDDTQSKKQKALSGEPMSTESPASMGKCFICNQTDGHWARDCKIGLATCSSKPGSRRTSVCPGVISMCVDFGSGCIHRARLANCTSISVRQVLISPIDTESSRFRSFFRAATAAS